MRGKWGGFGPLLATLTALTVLLSFGLTQPATADPVIGPPPTRVAVSQRATVAVVTWAPVPGSRGYAVDYDTAPTFPAARRVTAFETVAMLNWLTPQTTYYLRVASWDPATSTAGDWGATLPFTTAERAYPLAAPALAVGSPGTTAIEAEWAAVGSEQQYEVAIGETPTTLGNTRRTAKHAIAFDRLTKDTTYYLSIRALDGAGAPLSDWSDPLAVKTPQDVPLRAASFNIKCNNCRAKGEPSWAARKPAVVAAILGQKPDVLGVQEASQGRMRGRSVSQFVDLVNGLGAPYAATNRSRIGRGAGVDSRIIYNTRTVQLLEQGVVALPTSRKANIRRHLVWATFRQKATGKVFLFANTHLDNGGRFRALRLRQTRTIISTLKRISDGKLPTIVVGDFNTHKWLAGGNKPYDAMVAAGYLDPLGNTFKSRHSAPGAFVEKRINTQYSSTNGFERRARKLPYINGTYLDYIFVTRMRVSEWQTVVKVDERGRWIGTIPSDHNLIRATVWLP